MYSILCFTIYGTKVVKFPNKKSKIWKNQQKYVLLRENQWQIIMRAIKGIINWTFLGMFMMCLINLLFMHYQFLFTISLESPIYKISCFDNLLACLLDISIVLFIAWLLTFRRLRTSLTITFIITLLWSFCNVLYSRFFYQYLSRSAIGQAGNLVDDFMIDSTLAGIKAIDLFYLLMALSFCVFYYKTRHTDIKTRSLKTIVITWLLVLGMTFTVHAFYLLSPQQTIERVLIQTLYRSPIYDALWPNWTVFHRGSLRTLLFDHLNKILDGDKFELTEEQKKEIEEEYTDYHLRVTGRTAPDSINNIIFILVESYLSVSSDLIVDGQEITPNLNRLKHDSTTYFNGHMHPNVALGESSDGQLIYMAGLLPIRTEITAVKAKKKQIYGLPEQLKTISPNSTSYTLIPTRPTFWEQQGMTAAYGFEKLYSTIEYQAIMKEELNNDFIDDEKIFPYAANVDKKTTLPFMSLILTFSMHQPYDTYKEHGFYLKNKELPEKYRNYLTTCHYTDKQIGKYIDFLKERGTYNNSLIIIAADHDARPGYFDMEGIVKPEIPLYIINGGITSSTAWDGEFNQLDVYTTILDIMGIKSTWRGLGHTLLNKEYKNSVTERTQEISNWIINSDYFQGKALE